MEKRNKLLVVLVIILSILIVAIGGYIIYDKVLKDDNISENNDNTLVNYDEETLNLLNGKWLDCSKKSEDVDCNSINVSSENNYFSLAVYDKEGRTDFSVYSGKIIEAKKDGNYFNITVKETDDIEETEYTRYIKLDISKLSEKVIKIETVDNKKINSSNYYHAGSDYDKDNKYIKEEIKNIDSETIKKLESTFEFVYDYLDSTHPFCGESTDEEYLSVVEGTDIGYIKSTQFKSYNELLDYLKKYMSKDIIDNKEYYSWVEIVKKLDIYKEKDNNLYCLYDVSKGGGYYQIDKITITANNIDENKINSKVEVKMSWDSIWYEYYNVKYEKINDNWVITSYELRG